MSGLIAPKLTQHGIVYCVEKQERSFVVQQLLSQNGFKVSLALSLYDAIKLAGQELPHLIITEALLADGNAGNLFDKLQADPVLKKIPMMLHIVKKSKDELAVVTNRAFAGFYAGPIDQRSFLSKLNEIVIKHTSVSPFYYSMESCGQDSKAILRTDAQILGRSGDLIVAKSSTTFDPRAEVLCALKGSTGKDVVTLKRASNIKAGETFFNIFPLQRASGKGRKWLFNLKQIETADLKPVDAKSPLVHVPRRVLFFEPDVNKFNGYHKVLNGYKIELVHAKDHADVKAKLLKESQSFGALYFHELSADASFQEILTAHNKLPLNSKPPIIIGADQPNAKGTESMRFIKRPFGIGTLVEMLEAAFLRANNLLAAAATQANSQPNVIQGVQVVFEVDSDVLGLDEAGGVLQLAAPLVKGSKLTIGGNSFISSVIGADIGVQVQACIPSPANKDLWQARFSTIGFGLSKLKYWEKASRVLEIEFGKHQKVLAELAAAKEAEERERIEREAAVLAAEKEANEEMNLQVNGEVQADGEEISNEVDMGTSDDSLLLDPSLSKNVQGDSPEGTDDAQIQAERGEEKLKEEAA